MICFFRLFFLLPLISYHSVLLHFLFPFFDLQLLSVIVFVLFSQIFLIFNFFSCLGQLSYPSSSAAKTPRNTGKVKGLLIILLPLSFTRLHVFIKCALVSSVGHSFFNTFGLQEAAQKILRSLL